MSDVVTVPTAVVLLSCGVAAAIDLWKFKVPNALTLPMLGIGLVYQASTRGLAGLSSGLLGMLLALAVLMIVYALGGMGAGDVKLMAAVGAWLGPSMTIEVLLASSLAAAAYSVVLVAISGRWLEYCVRWYSLWRSLVTLDVAGAGTVRDAVERPDRRRRVIPFAAMAAVGVMTAIVRT